MILTPIKTIETHQQSGIWGRVTLDALFRKTAAAHPDRIALADAPDRADTMGGRVRTLTYAQADAEIGRMAGFLSAVGLGQDSVIGLQSPNTVDAVLTFLAILRAGMVVAPLPLYWRQKNVLAALNRAGARALIAGESFGGRNIGHEARDTAADMFSLRFVFGLGAEVADGLIEMDAILREAGDELAAPPARRDANPADHVASLTWTHSTSGEPLPIARSHNHWIAAGLMPYLELGLPQAPRIVVPYALTAMAGIGAGLVPWLLGGGTLHLHQPRSLGRLAAHADQAEADMVLVPGALLPALDRRLESGTCRLVPVWSAHAPAPAPHPTNRSVTDVHIADEFAMFALRRDGSVLPRPLRLGRVAAPSDADAGPTLVDVALDTDTTPNTLKVRGPMVADSAWPACKVRVPTDKAGFVDTLVPVRHSDGGLAGFGMPGSSAPGIPSLPALDALFGAFPGLTEAAAFLVEDGILGARLYAALVPQQGLMLDVEGFFAYLEAECVGLCDVPHRILSINALPRRSNGAIDRDALIARVGKGQAAVA